MFLWMGNAGDRKWCSIAGYANFPNKLPAAVSITSFPGGKTIRVSWTANGYPSGDPGSLVLAGPTCGCFFVVLARSRGSGKKITNGTNRAFLVVEKLLGGGYTAAPFSYRTRTKRRKSKLSHLRSETLYRARLFVLVERRITLHLLYERFYCFLRFENEFTEAYNRGNV